MKSSTTDSQFEVLLDSGARRYFLDEATAREEAQGFVRRYGGCADVNGTFGEHYDAELGYAFPHRPLLARYGE